MENSARRMILIVDDDPLMADSLQQMIKMIVEDRQLDLHIEVCAVTSVIACDKARLLVRTILAGASEFRLFLMSDWAAPEPGAGTKLISELLKLVSADARRLEEMPLADPQFYFEAVLCSGGGTTAKEDADRLGVRFIGKPMGLAELCEELRLPIERLVGR